MTVRVPEHHKCVTSNRFTNRGECLQADRRLRTQLTIRNNKISYTTQNRKTSRYTQGPQLQRDNTIHPEKTRILIVQHTTTDSWRTNVQKDKETRTNIHDVRPVMDGPNDAVLQPFREPTLRPLNRCLAHTPARGSGTKSINTTRSGSISVDVSRAAFRCFLLLAERGFTAYAVRARGVLLVELDE